MEQQQQLPFDLQAYISRYNSNAETYLQRLLFLAHHFHTSTTNETTSNNDITKQAFELAIDHMKKCGNHRRYLEEYGAVVDPPPSAGSPVIEGGVGMLNVDQQHAPSIEGGGSSTTPIRTHSNSRSTSPTGHHTPKHIIQQYQEYDGGFVTQSKVSLQQMSETLEARLSTAQSRLMKDSIRTALIALAEFHRDRGDLREAWRRVARSREYCANGNQHTQVCLLLVELSVDLKEWSSVRDTVSRAEHTVMGDIDDSLFHQKLRVGQALSHLAEGRYLESAKIFTSIDTQLTNQFNSVISAEDLAVYGSILGLATMNRDMLHGSVIDGPFKARLELVPAMREVLRHYSKAEYGQCLALLQSTVQRDLLLDIHLHAHVPILFDMIRDRCIIQYFKPYSSVSLEKMGTVFGCTTTEMEDIVANLISNGGVEGMSLGEGARINALEKTLSVEGPASVERKARRKARVKAAKMGVLFTRNAEGMLLRAACMENGVVIQGDKRSGWRNRGGRGRDRRAPDRMMGDDLDVDSEGSFDDYEDLPEDMDIDIVNPNEDI